MENKIRYIGYIILLILLWNGNATSYLHSNWKYYRKPIAKIPIIPVDTNKKKEDYGSFVQQEEAKTDFLNSPKNVKREVTYDIKTNKYLVTEKLGNINVKPPMYLTYEEYLALTEKTDFGKYVVERNSKANVSNIDIKNTNSILSGFKIPTQGMIFGDGGIEIKPQGNLDVQMGYNHNTIKNPALTPIQQSQGLMDFDMAMNVSVMGKIGDKFQNTLKYNNQGGFGFDGQKIKLAYNGKEDEIIRNVEAGDISFEVPTQLIKSAQSLFGVKSELQFGKLNIKTALSQQRSNKQVKSIENGTVTENFEITCDLYDQNRHYFLNHFFRDNYEKALLNYPMINSPYQVSNVEVWVSNRNVSTQSVRDVIGFQDLGENKPFSPWISAIPGQTIPSNKSNDLYDRIKLDDNIRNGNTALFNLQTTYNLVSYQDFEKGFLRKLNPSEYTLNTQLGFISLNSNLQSNDILAVSYQYTYNGNVYQVGDLSRDITLPDSLTNQPSRVLYLKLLKGTNVTPRLPTWNLMMKNVYALPAYQINKENFRLDIYYNDPGGGVKRYLPKGSLQEEPLIRTMGVDRLNLNNEPHPDGVFDFVPNITINPTNGKIYFPVLEPFGSSLKNKLNATGNGALVPTYVYQYLYDSTQFVAQQYPELNRFIIKGTYQSTINKRISLGLNTPQGSVYVTMNGQRLQEGVDYIVEYGSFGYVELSDQIMASGGKIQLEFENNATFGLQTKNFIGARMEYRFNDQFKIGTTYEKLSERPFNNKINYGEDPISNQILGGDISFSSELPILTKWLDKLPFYKTNEMSSITAYGEYAQLFPGHYSSIGTTGTIYLDDFEGASIGYGFGNPASNWRLASTPTGAKDELGKLLFPEATMIDNLQYGYNRARLSWYNIASTFYWANNTTPAYITGSKAIQDNLYQRQYRIADIFPKKNIANINNLQQTLDIAYYPNQRGPYNYEASANPTAISQGLNSDGTLKAPPTRWAGIQRTIENTNFETNNIEYIQFWMLDPFIKNKNNKGDMYFNLGYISEDVLKDSRMSFEQGLVNKVSASNNLIGTSNWAWVPKSPPIINAFDNDNRLRQYQDIGLDGANNIDEKEKFRNFLNQARVSLTPAAYQVLENDPSSDDFKHYLNSELISQQKDIIGLYKFFNGTENNSPIIDASATIPQSSYITPDNEDINRDNTLNENEAYYQYRMKLFPGMDVGTHPYIVSKTVSPQIRDQQGDSATWFQFRIPIKEYNHKVGQIGDFRNIQFIRMFVTNFNDSVVMRMTEVNFVRNQWRKYSNSIDAPTDYIPQDNGEKPFFDVGSVGLEEHSSKKPVNYVTPPGIVREIGLNATSNPIQLNEQSLRLNFCNLKDGSAKACFKNIDFDLRQYKTMRLFCHAENNPDAINPMKDYDLSAFIRVGSDFVSNYYEYEVPLKVTPPGVYNNNSDNDRAIVWPDLNQMTINLEDLVNAKNLRNRDKFPAITPYVYKVNNNNITIIGNPDLGMVKVAMIGVRNRAKNDRNNFKQDDDGMPKCGEVWVNELRLEGLNEEGGSAAVANISVKLADLGTATLTGSMHTIGYGQIYERVNERKKDDYFQYNFTTNLQLGKFLPKELGIQLPFYLQTGEGISSPQFDPFSHDIKTKKQYETIAALYGSDSANKYLSSAQTIDKRFGFNFTNVKIIPTKPSTKAFLLAPRFFTATYAFNSIKKSNPFVSDDWIRTYLGELNYNYAAQPKYIEPFKTMIKSKTKAWDWIKYINVNLVPNSISITNRLERTYGIFQQRQLAGESFSMPTQYIKSFVWNRGYSFDYNPMRPLNINFTATNLARIDEPQGAINTKEKQDSIMNNIMKLGRTTSYTQAFGLKYSLPFNKIQSLSFITSSINYGSTYNWTTGPQIINSSGQIIQSPQGNIITNGQNVGTNLTLKMAKLYSMIPYLKNIDLDNPKNNPYLTKEQKDIKNDILDKEHDEAKAKLENAKDELDKLKTKRKEIKDNEKLTDEERKSQLKTIKEQIKNQRAKIRDIRKQVSNALRAPDIIKAVIQPILAIREIEASYNIDNSTTVSGFTQKTKYFGVDYDQTHHLNQGFVFGEQPGLGLFDAPDQYARYRWLDNLAAKGMMTRDTTFNLPFLQSNTKSFKAKMVLEPFKGIKINLNWESTYAQKFSEFFIFNPITGTFEHRNPMESGSYTYTDINLLTAFNPISSTGKSENITTMDQNRQLYATIFQGLNPYSSNQTYIDPMTNTTKPNYYMGYGPLQQDVLLNSFLTTYRGGKASGGDQSISPFSRLPLPNWTIQYNGLTQYPLFKNIFTSFSIRHGYSSKTTISNFNSEFRYQGGGSITNPVKIDSLNNNFIPYYFIPNIATTETFNPLLGIDFTLKNSLNLRFEYRSSRTISLSLIDYQLTENLNSGFTIGAGYMAKTLTLPFRGEDGKPFVLKNGVKFSCDVTYSNTYIVNHKLGQGIDIPVGGAVRLQINPKIDTRINDKFSISLFYNYVFNEPRISNSFETINGAAGAKMSFSLTP